MTKKTTEKGGEMDLLIKEVVDEMRGLAEHPTIAGNAYLRRKLLGLADKLSARL